MKSQKKGQPNINKLSITSKKKRYCVTIMAVSRKLNSKTTTDSNVTYTRSDRKGQ